MAARPQDVILTAELDLLLTNTPAVLQALPEQYLIDLRERLNLISPEQTSHLRNLPQVKKDLFLNHIVNPNEAMVWKNTLLTDDERKLAEESKQRDEQAVLLMQREAQQRREQELKEETERAAREKAAQHANILDLKRRCGF